MGDPFAQIYHVYLVKSKKKNIRGGRQLDRRVTYLLIEGPAFSTKAESNLYRSLGCSIIEMTNHKETRLAKKAEIAYSPLSMITDYDCWH